MDRIRHVTIPGVGPLALVLVLGFELLVAGGCSRQENQPRESLQGSGRDKGRAASPESPALRVVVTTSGITTAETKVDLEHASVHAEGTDLAPEGWRVLRCKITSAEAERLRSIVRKAGLFDFRPDEAKWFSDYRQLDGSATLRIVWREKARGFLVPPKEWRTGLPEDTFRKYQWMDSVVSEVEMIKARYADEAQPAAHR